MGQIGEFVDALFGNVDDDKLWFLSWTLRDKLSHWNQTDALETVEASLEKLAKNNSDLYVGVSLFDKSFGQHSRGDATDSKGIVGLWIDVDIADDVHRKDGLPPTAEDARALISDMGVAPSVLIHSGHGYQAWWLFPEPWIFENEEERLEAAKLARRWNDTLRWRAAARKWVVDSTYDLARVMRIPGTMNRKAAPVPVELIDNNAKRFNPSELEELCVDDGQVRAIDFRRTYEVGKLILDPKREPPLNKLEALQQNVPEFRKVWEGSRKDLSSPSERDLSLASFAARAGWSDQEIADLLIYFRKRRGEDQKLRQSYYGPTIIRSRDDSDREVALEKMDETLVALDQAHFGSDGEKRDARLDALMALSQTLGVDISRIIKFTGEPAIWRLISPVGEITLGTAEVVLSAKKMKQKLYEVAGVVLPNYTQPSWDRIAETIQRVMEEEEVSNESTDAGQMHAWLADFLSMRPPVLDRDEATSTEHPFRDGVDVVIFSSSFRQWLKLSQGERVSNKEIGLMMRVFGGTSEQFKLKVGDKMTTRSVWRFNWAD